MHAKIISIDIRSDRHGFEALDEHFINLLIVELLKYFGPERKMFRHGARLMISSQHDNLAWIVKLEAEEEDADFEGENAPINVVTEEEQVRPKHDLK